MAKILFTISLVLEVFYVVMFVLTIRRPGFSFWPPPSPRSWQFFVSWFVAGVVAVNFLFVGLLDFDSGFLHTRLRFPVGILLHLAGTAIGSWAFAAIGFNTNIGLGKKLVTGGPYRYSRNPEYIGDMLHILGYMVLTNSCMAWMIGILGLLLNLMAPFTEEPWLEGKFGEIYRSYKSRVPRFIRIRLELRGISARTVRR
jgi:protein-S-isoprenylcysteine O-methyltransferase Ste14